MILPAVALAGLMLGGRLAPRPQTASEQIPSEAAQWIQKGDGLSAKNDLPHALDAYKKADALTHHQCTICLLRVARAERGLGDLGKAANAALQAAAAAQGNPALLAVAESQAGDLLAAEAGFHNPKSKALKAAEAAYRASLAVTSASGGRDSLDFKLGVVQMREKHAAEGLAALQALAAKPGVEVALAKEARAITANPNLAFEYLAPDFSVAASDGQTYSKDALAGKVALLDFWGSWCPPCRESVPMVAQLRKTFAKNTDFAVLGVGNDASAAVMERYAAAHHMDWPEYFDGDNSISRKFVVDALPTFIVIQRDGSIAFRTSGLEENAAGDPVPTESQLESAIRQALRRH